MAQQNRSWWVILAVLVLVVLLVPLLGGGMMGWGMLGPGMMGWPGAATPGAGGWAWGLAMGLGWLAMLAFWGAILVGIVLVVRALARSSGASSGGHEESALAILKRRYAAGELTREQFDEMRRVLEQS